MKNYGKKSYFVKTATDTVDRDWFIELDFDLTRNISLSQRIQGLKEKWKVLINMCCGCCVSGMSNLQRSSSQRSNMMYQRNNYALNTIYTEAYQSTPYWSPDPSYSRQPMDDDATRSPSVDSLQKDPR